MCDRRSFAPLAFAAILIGNTLINAFFIAGLRGFRSNTPLGVIFIFLLIGGFFRSLQFTALNTVAFAEIPESRC